MKRFVVIGAGISGLSFAYYLKKRIEREDISLTILEKEDRVGGTIRTENKDGFIFEAGPRGFLAEGRRTLLLSYELGLWDELLVSSDLSRIRFMFENGTLNALKGFNLLRLMGFSGISSILGEFFKKSSSDSVDESVYSFISRRFSPKIMDRFVELIVSGIYAGDPKRLSASSVFPKLKELESTYGSIIKGLIKNRAKQKKASQKKASKEEEFNKEILSIGKRQLVSYKGGLSTITSALSSKLSSELKLSVTIDKLVYNDGDSGKILVSYKDALGKHNSIEADKLIFATPSYDAAKCLESSIPELSSLLKDIEYAHMGVFCLGFKKMVHSYRGFGFLSPKKEGLGMLGCIWNDMVYPSFAPSSCVNLTAMYGGALHPDMAYWDDDKLLSLLRKDLFLSMGIKDRWDISKLYRYKRGIPQYNIGHAKRIESIKSILERHKSIYLLGNYLNGIGMNDCINNAYSLSSTLDFAL